MSASTCAQFLSALRMQLQSRFASLSGFQSVQVHLVAPGDVSLDDAVVLVFGRIEGSQERLAMGGQRRDSWRIPAMAQAQAADPDSSVAFRDAMVRAEAIASEVIQEVAHSAPAVGVSTLDALVSPVALQPIALESGGWGCQALFTIDYQAHVA